MAQVIQETAIQNFYRRWGPTVFGFCSLLLGNETWAESITAGTFVTYVQRDLELDLVTFPSELLAIAWNQSESLVRLHPQSTGHSGKLNDAILHLPAKERAAFILRSVMAIDELEAGNILGMPLETLRKAWFRAVLELRRLLPPDFLKERSA